MKPVPTKTRCITCQKVSDATLFERNGDVHLKAHCSQCGESESFFCRDAKFFEDLRRYHPQDKSVPVDGFQKDWSNFAPMATTCTIDVTKRCNLQCPDCFSSAGERGGSGDEPSLEEILNFLPPVPQKGFRPNISLVGGESILRKDICEIISGIKAKGFTPRLNSNGKALLDPDLLKRLQNTGLKWVILQFDGFSPETSLRFRGEDLIEHKLKVIERLADYGINVHFAVMVEKGVNDKEITEILRYALKTPNVRRVSFYPRTEVGRHLGEGGGTSTGMIDLVEALETGTSSGITRMDLIAFKKIWKALYAITRNPVFLNRSCLLPFMITGDDKGDLLPLNRILYPGTSVQRWKKLLSLAMQLPRLWNFDKGQYKTNILPVNIEKFYDTRAFDLSASANCHQVYLTSHGYIPFCLYNSFYRGGPETGC